MKKFLSLRIIPIFLMVFLISELALAGDIITKDQSKLPAEARNFISEHFSGKDVSHIKIDDGLFESTSYEVVFSDGTNVEFDDKGLWKEIDCEHSAVPMAAIPQKIRDYVQANFPEQRITHIERERRGFEVELLNDLTLEFDQNGTFKRLDD